MSECDLFSDYAAFTTEKPFDFTKNSSIGCGGNAEIAFYPRTQEEMKKLLQYASSIVSFRKRDFSEGKSA